MINKDLSKVFSSTLDKITESNTSLSNSIIRSENEEVNLSFIFNNLNQSIQEIEKVVLKKEKEFYVDHRKRTKERFLNGDPNSFLDYDILEMILFYIIPRIDVKPIAKKMIDKFKNLSGITIAKREELSEFIGNPDSLLFFLRLNKEISTRNCIQELSKENILRNWSEVIKYLKIRIGSINYEEFHVLCLDTKYRLIEDIHISSGTIDEVYVYKRDFIKKVVQSNTKYVILSHNHPSGSIEPSESDLKITEELEKALHVIEISVIDHIIIGKNNKEIFSFKANQLLINY